MTLFLRINLLVSALLISAAALPGDYDPETMEVSLAAQLPAEMFKGTHYSIADDVRVSGYMNHYTVDSDFGQFTPVGNRKLKILLREIDAIAELRAMTSTGVGTSAVIGTVTDTGKSVAALVTNPVGTAKNMGAGVSRMFKRTTKTSKDVGQQISQQGSKDGDGEVSGEDDGEVAGEDSSADPGADPAATEEPRQSGLSSSIASGFLGIGKAQRKIAEQLRVDPYSDNPVLQAELARVAEISGTVGKLSKILMPIPSVVSTASSVSNMVWSLSPTDLLIQNQETLKKLGYDKALIEKFFSNKVYSPTEQTVLVAAVKSMDQVKGREILIQNASLMESAIEGGFMVRSVLFAEIYHEQVNPVVEFIASPAAFVPIVITESGDGVVFAPLDHLLWTENVEKAVTEMSGLMDEHGGGKQHLLWVEGEFSPLALKNLASNGWVVSSRAFDKLEELTKE